MDKTQQLENRIALLEKQLEDLKTSSSIPFNLIKSLEGRGFLTNSNIVFGYGTCNFSGEYRLVIPNATSSSIVFVTPINSSTGQLLEAVIRKSPSDTRQYELYVQGVSTDTFAYIVFLSVNSYTQL